MSGEPNCCTPSSTNCLCCSLQDLSCRLEAATQGKQTVEDELLRLRHKAADVACKLETTGEQLTQKAKNVFILCLVAFFAFILAVLRL